ncbi:hypothetical protein [Parendozoicomonas haliclonae]|uniref:Spore Coat Protein U domain protein n=1 Tax=Parendozoicomonas haliclonae TaxID=1960125 RepID=A0A1X7AGX0_9GAMM|nr:hypothetical protein [Parendozoicomonas haliclonae]SMA39313.1 hypothetical protein EHSB41UT_01009 [Parendozoicomonas haliclonae]
MQTYLKTLLTLLISASFACTATAKITDNAAMDISFVQESTAAIWGLHDLTITRSEPTNQMDICIASSNPYFDVSLSSSNDFFLMPASPTASGRVMYTASVIQKSGGYKGDWANKDYGYHAYDSGQFKAFADVDAWHFTPAEVNGKKCSADMSNFRIAVGTNIGWYPIASGTYRDVITITVVPQ